MNVSNPYHLYMNIPGNTFKFTWRFTDYQNNTLPLKDLRRALQIYNTILQWHPRSERKYGEEEKEIIEQEIGFKPEDMYEIYVWNPPMGEIQEDVALELYPDLGVQIPEEKQEIMSGLPRLTFGMRRNRVTYCTFNEHNSGFARLYLNGHRQQIRSQDMSETEFAMYHGSRCMRELAAKTQTLATYQTGHAYMPQKKVMEQCCDATEWNLSYAVEFCILNDDPDSPRSQTLHWKITGPWEEYPDPLQMKELLLILVIMRESTGYSQPDTLPNKNRPGRLTVRYPYEGSLYTYGRLVDNDMGTPERKPPPPSMQYRIEFDYDLDTFMLRWLLKGTHGDILRGNVRRKAEEISADILYRIFDQVIHGNSNNPPYSMLQNQIKLR